MLYSVKLGNGDNPDCSPSRETGVVGRPDTAGSRAIASGRLGSLPYGHAICIGSRPLQLAGCATRVPRQTQAPEYGLAPSPFRPRNAGTGCVKCAPNSCSTGQEVLAWVPDRHRAQSGSGVGLGQRGAENCGSTRTQPSLGPTSHRCARASSDWHKCQRDGRARSGLA